MNSCEFRIPHPASTNVWTGSRVPTSAATTSTARVTMLAVETLIAVETIAMHPERQASKAAVRVVAVAATVYVEIDKIMIMEEGHQGLTDAEVLMTVMLNIGWCISIVGVKS